MEDRALVTVARSCVELFEQSLGEAGQLAELAEEKVAFDVEQFLDNQSGRFRIWANNIGVFAGGHASLDYRLRDSPFVKNLMMVQLGQLLGHLYNGKLESDRSPVHSGYGH
jgi:hypothetical protein